MGFLLGGLTASKPQAKTKPAYTGLQTQTSSYGGVVVLVFGATRVAPNIIWYGDFLAIPHTTKTKSGGKGGGSANTATTTYTYQTAVALGLCQGICTKIGTVWKAKAQTTLAAEGFTFFNGAYGQAAWSYLVTNHPTQAIRYSGTCYIAADALDLADSADLPNYTFEIFGLAQNGISSGPDALPRDIVTLLTTNAYWGAGLPSALLDASMTQFNNWCKATGMVMSPAYSEAKPCAEHIQDILTLTSSAWVWYGGIYTIIPYAEVAVSGNGTTFTPALTPEYDLTDDDFLTDPGNDPIKLKRKRPSDAYNSVKLEYLLRSNQYNSEVVETKNQAAIDQYGLRPMSTTQAHQFCLTQAALQSAHYMLLRESYLNTYEFSVGWKFILLDPMDIITITDTKMGIIRQPVRILEITEDDQGRLAMVVEELLTNQATGAVFAEPQGTRYSVDYNVAPGPINIPIMFEPPLALLSTGVQLEIWCGVSGVNPNTWGGCNVWVSYDGDTYQEIQDRVVGSSNMGVTTATLASFTRAAVGNTLDTIHTLAVDVTKGNGTLLSGTAQDAQNLATLCYVGGELIAYQTATLTGSHKYNLTYLIRGAYSSTIASHAAGTNFMRLDQSIIRVPVNTENIGRQIYLKFQGFNIYGGAIEDLADVPAYTYTPTGAALASALANPTNVTTAFVANILQITWDPIVDLRSPIDYEVRKGATFANSQVLGRTDSTHGFPAHGDGTYWISAHYRAPTGLDIYSFNPPSIDIVGADITQNIIASWDEGATGWSGTLTSMVKDGLTIELQGAGDLLSSSDWLAETDLLFGGVVSSGYYEAPAGHIITLAAVNTCPILMAWEVFGVSLSSDFLDIADFLGNPDFLGAQFNAEVSVQPQVSLSQDGVTYAAWINWNPGSYTFLTVKARILVSTLNPAVNAIVGSWQWGVDVPDLIQSAFGVPILAAGSTITFPKKYNLATPAVSVTILDRQTGDVDVLTEANINASGFTFQVLNGGVGVARHINWISRGFSVAFALLSVLSMWA